ncbi:hypothetical protein [Aureimonas sp. Leaf324]|uniref:hypothetical protein n=1 Tax=Aureimonas sp. Leaf324 TaxID=1736336 RepID=UPI0012E15CFD|nr:hypothetical protein [Aureimonas sp. Leaf324]
MIQFFRFEGIPDHVEFDQYRHVECQIETGNGVSHCLLGTIYRPKNRRNVVGVRNEKYLILLLEVDLGAEQMLAARIKVNAFGTVLSEGEIQERNQHVRNQLDAHKPS